MKIEVVYVRKTDMKFAYKTIRVPSNIKVLNVESVKEIMISWIDRRKKVTKYWRSVGKTWRNDIGDDIYFLVSWSPVITSSALEFICQNF